MIDCNCIILGTVELPANKFVSDEENVNTLTHKKIVLNSNDEIFAETRQVNKWINYLIYNTCYYQEKNNSKITFYF
jgi:hypothetical protein